MYYGYTMNIALIYSPNWKEYVLVELYAIFKHNPAPVKVYLISDADGYVDTSHITNYFGDGYTVEFIDAERHFKRRIPKTVNVSTRFTKYTLYRLIIPELINDDRLLYIDADAIVCGDLKELYNTQLGKNLIAGAIDIGADFYNLKKPLGLSSTDIYINAGIILMDLKQIRESNVYIRWIYEANTKHYNAHDQDIINKTCKGKIKVISNAYNCSVSTGLEVPKNVIKIMHYAGGLKPWQSNKVPNFPIWNRLNKEYKSIFSEVKGVIE